MELKIVHQDGKEAGQIDLKQSVLTKAYNSQLLSFAVNSFLSSRRETRALKNRGDTRGSTRKIYRQKGTGNARHGDRRAPIYVGGGQTFQPRTNFEKKMPRKVKREALRSALNYCLQEKTILIIDEIKIEEFKTKIAKKVLKDLSLNQALIVVENPSLQLKQSFSNLPDVKVVVLRSLNIVDLLNYEKVLFEKSAFENLLSSLDKA